MRLLKVTEKYLQKLGSKLQEAKAVTSHFEGDEDEVRMANAVEKNENVVDNDDETDQAKHHFLRDRFVTNYLTICMNHIIAVLRIPAERASGFIALGEFAGALDGELVNYLPTITSHLREACAGMQAIDGLKKILRYLVDEATTMISTLIILLSDLDSATVKAAWEALSKVVSFVPKEVLSKALQPLLPIFLQGLISGSAELREQAAIGLGELVEVTSEKTLKEFVIPKSQFYSLCRISNGSTKFIY